MKPDTLKSAVEAVLFAAGEPITAVKVAEALGESAGDVLDVIEELSGDYDSRLSGICLLRLEDRFQLASRPMFELFVKAALDSRRKTPLSQAAMETLAIIAYNQPVSRAFIEQIRGVDSSSSVENLLSKGLITEAGRLELPGRPISFRTTDAFLRSFGMSSLADLPPVKTLEDDAPSLFDDD